MKTGEKTVPEGFDPRAASEKMLAAFDPRVVTENVLKLVKFSIDTTFDNAAKIQELNDKVFRDMIEAGKKVQEDAVNAVDELSKNVKKGITDYRKAVEDGFKKVEELLQAQK